MAVSPYEIARVLSEALPHMQQYDEEIVVVKYAFDGVQIEIRRQIHYRTVFLIKRPRGRRAVAVAAHQVLEHPPMRRQVAIEIHAQEAGEL